LITPPQAPFPTDCSLPFQVEPALDPCAEAGNQTSTAISESVVGRSVAVTRQNAGRSANGRHVIPATSGGVKVPLEIVSVAVIVVAGSDSDRRLSHVLVAAWAVLDAAAATPNAAPMIH
jgi:hypothetical protein